MSPTAQKSPGARVGDLFRRTAGLPERKSSAPLTNDGNETSELHLATEPEGGYGGEGGIANTGAVNETEARLRKEADERKAAREPDQPHQLDSDQHHVPEAEKPSTTGVTEPAKKPAKKAAAKKTAAKK